MNTVEQCTNKVGFSLPFSQIIFYKDPDTNKIYCFDIKEIARVIKTGVNPFTSKPISKEFIQDLVLKHQDKIKKELNKISEKIPVVGKIKSFVEKNKDTILSASDIIKSVKK